MLMTADRSPQADIVPFRVETYPERDRVRVVPVGELDVATADELQTVLRDLREARFTRVVLDLRELEFLGSAGLKVLVVESQLARGAGHDFALASGPPAVQRVIEICGLVEHLRLVA